MASEWPGGLEALQRKWRGAAGSRSDQPYIRATADAMIQCADALAPHIAAAKEREEKLWAIVDDAVAGNSNWAIVRLKEILGPRRSA